MPKDRIQQAIESLKKDVTTYEQQRGGHQAIIKSLTSEINHLEQQRVQRLELLKDNETKWSNAKATIKILSELKIQGDFQKER